MSQTVQLLQSSPDPDKPNKNNRALPYDIQAEESLVGAMLTSHTVIDDITEVFGSESQHFYSPANQEVFNAIMNVYSSMKEVDIITVADVLRRRGILEKIGGEDELLRIQGVPPNIGNARHYAEIVRTHGISRNLIEALDNSMNICYEEQEDLAQTIDMVQSLIYQVTEQQYSNQSKELGALLKLNLENLENIANSGNIITGTPSGFADLDNLLNGFQRENLIIIGARPSVGKTSLALNMAANIAKKEIPVLFFSLEMGSEELSMRVLSSEAKVDSWHLRNAKLDAEDWTRLTTAVGNAGSMPLHIDDSPSLTIMELRSKARRMSSRISNLGAIFVDYLQLMTPHKSKENRQVEVSEISRGLKTLARELKIPVIALSQLSRITETRTDKRPMLSDLRESGSIEQDADVVMFLYREKVYNNNAPEPNVAELNVAKHRSGRTDKIRLHFDDDHTRFSDLSTSYSDDPTPL